MRTTETVQLAPSSLPADGHSNSIATATVKDEDGNPIRGEAVAFTASDPRVGVSATTNEGDGTYTATLTSSEAPGELTITATDTTASATGTARLTQLSPPGPLETFMTWFVPILAISCLIAWAAAVGFGIVANLILGHNDAGFMTGDAMKYVMPGLAGLIGGVAAMAFGLARSNSSDDNWKSLANQLVPGRDQIAWQWVAIAYIVLYFLGGALAFITWVARDGNSFEYLRTLAVAVAGLAIAIAGGYMQNSARSPAGGNG